MMRWRGWAPRFRPAPWSGLARPPAALPGSLVRPVGHQTAGPPPPPTASYEADPEHVHRVLLLYSGGLDTSVMLKWIQERYGAEVSCLAVNLGQPGEDFQAIRDKALQLGARDCQVVDAREEIAYAREHGIPLKGGNEAVPYSIDDNLWGRSSEGRWIEDLEHPPEDDVFGLVTRPEDAPHEGERVVIEFERGLPVALDGERLELVPLIGRLAELGARHGVGIVDHIEDRIVGLKVRDIYEAPAATIVLGAHQELERLVCTIHENQFKPQLDRQWAYLVYAGLWWEPLRADLDAYMERVNERVGGTIGVKLYKGRAQVITRSSPNALYD